MAGNRDQFPAQLCELSDGWKMRSHKQVFAGLSNYLSLGMISRIMARVGGIPAAGTSAKVRPS
jgi:hypothetical protein